ncbi:MAG: UDP-N-acetyl glucosamine 2-epimerase, partial [Chloroflexi bacterium]|nr:UDP-N-acetyl glucosamine 2-epimerase [Chloroflexota bacterium]
VWVTAQHREMLDQVHLLFDIKPDIDLDLMKPDQSPAEVASAAVKRLSSVLADQKPDWLLVQGDTTTAMAAALAGFYMGVKVGHVEAGLRSGRRMEPFPEEINRRMISVLADLHFAPTERAKKSLLAEGIDERSIFVTGNTVIDALLDVAGRPPPERVQTLLQQVSERALSLSLRPAQGKLRGPVGIRPHPHPLPAGEGQEGPHPHEGGRLRAGNRPPPSHSHPSAGSGAVLSSSKRQALPKEAVSGQLPMGEGAQRILLVTAHRRESFGKPLEQICLALQELATKYWASLDIVYPVHMNPNVAGPVQRILGDIPNVALVEPLDYASLVHVMKRAYLVLTDSGGIQEEAPALGKPVLVMRAVTERTEAIDTGAVKLIGTSTDRIVGEVSQLLDDKQAYAQMAITTSPYGDGRASERIVGALMAEPIEQFSAARPLVADR